MRKMEGELEERERRRMEGELEEREEVQLGEEVIGFRRVPSHHPEQYCVPFRLIGTLRNSGKGYLISHKRAFEVVHTAVSPKENQRTNKNQT